MAQAKRGVQAVVDGLSTGGTVRCKDMIRSLEGLGFVVRDGRKQRHKVITHPALTAFTSAAFTCGHGRNPQVRPIYTESIRKLLEFHSDELGELEKGDVENRESGCVQHHRT